MQQDASVCEMQLNSVAATEYVNRYYESRTHFIFLNYEFQMLFGTIISNKKKLVSINEILFVLISAFFFC